MRRLSNKAKFTLVGVGFLMIAIIIFIVLAIILHWDIGAFFVHPITIIVAVILVCVGVTIAAYLINKKIRGD